MEFLSLFLLFTTLTLLGYGYVKHKHSYWSRRGIPFIPPKFFIGNVQGFKKRQHSSGLLQTFYRNMKGSGLFCGIYLLVHPVLIALDLEFIKNVLVKDFPNFHDRSVYVNERDDPLSAHLVSLNGARWKNLRVKLTPTFSSSKMKMMFPTILEVGAQFKEFLSESATVNPVFEIKGLVSKFTTDVIGTCAFGIECNSFKNPNAKFCQMGQKVFDVPRTVPLKQFFGLCFPKLADLLHITITAPDVAEFFLGVVRETVKYREDNDIKRNDFMDLLIQLKNEEIVKTSADSNAAQLTLEEIAAQAFIFFLGGFETSATVMTFTLYELAMNQEVQELARKCVRDTLEKHNGVLTYEAISEMVYLDQCINESMRKYPPIPHLMRDTTSDYHVPNTDLIIERNTKIMVPIYAIQHDPEYFPNPEKFDPMRFSPEEVALRNPFTFMPFGEGPRVCIGMRFGMMQTRMGLATLLSSFRFTPTDTTPNPIVFSKRSLVLTTEGGLYLNINKL